MKSDLIDVTVQMHAETEKAVLVSDDGDKDKAVWIPKSQCEIEFDASMKVRGNGAATLTLPRMARDRKGAGLMTRFEDARRFALDYADALIADQVAGAERLGFRGADALLSGAAGL